MDEYRIVLRHSPELDQWRAYLEEGCHPVYLPYGGVVVSYGRSKVEAMQNIWDQIEEVNPDLDATFEVVTQSK